MLGALGFAEPVAEVVELGTQPVGVGNQDHLRSPLALELATEVQQLGTGPGRRLFRGLTAALGASYNRLVVVDLLGESIDDRLGPAVGT